jgi:hypothetical protein
VVGGRIDFHVEDHQETMLAAGARFHMRPDSLHIHALQPA